MKTTINTTGAILRLALFIGLLTYAFNSKAQERSISAAGGIGVLDTSGFAVQLKLQYEHKYVGLTGGFMCAPRPSEPCIFNLELFTPICLDNNSRILPRVGYAYSLVTFDDKTRNGSTWLGGATLEFSPQEQTFIYMDITLIELKQFAFFMGMRISFSK